MNTKTYSGRFLVFKYLNTNDYLCLEIVRKMLCCLEKYKGIMRNLMGRSVRASASSMCRANVTGSSPVLPSTSEQYCLHCTV